MADYTDDEDHIWHERAPVPESLRVVRDPESVRVVRDPESVRVVRDPESVRVRKQGRVQEQVRVTKLERSREFVREVDTYDRELRYILEPILKEERVRGQVAERLEEIRRDARLREKTAVELLHALGSLPDEDYGPKYASDDESGPTVPLSEAPPPVKTPGGLLSPFILKGRRMGGHSSSASEADETDVSDVSHTASHRSAHSSSRQTPAPPPPAAREPNFFEWTKFRVRPLAVRENFVQKHHEAILATYKDMNINVEAYGFSFGLNNFLFKVRDWCHRRDLLALWRSSSGREILVPEAASASEIPKGTTIDDLERQLFDVGKFYDGSGRHLTALTYGDGDYGTVTLFRVDTFETLPHLVVPRRLRPVAAMDRVPKAIVKKIVGQVKSSEKTTLRMRKGALWWGPRNARAPAVKRLRSRSGRDHGVRGGLRHALAQIPNVDDSDAVAATVPQILAWLHFRSGVLQEVESGPVRVGKRRRVQVSWREGPREVRHDASNVKIVVLSPADSKWSKERIVWC